MFRVIQNARFHLCRQFSSLPTTAFGTSFPKQPYIFSYQYRNMHKEFANRKVLDRFHLRDRVPKNYTLIYRSNLPNYLMSCQVVVALTIGAFFTAIATVYITVLTKEVDKKPIETSPQLPTEVEVQKWEEVKRPDDQGINVPAISDLKNAPVEDLLLMGLCFTVLALSLFRLQRQIPVRIYTNNKKHCIAILYGSLVPARTTQHEFVAGTLKSVATKPSGIWWSDSVYRDGSRKKLLLMEHFFRYPADLNRLLGFKTFEDNGDEDVEKKNKINH